MTPDSNIFLIDDQNPEDIAMMQALYSRSAASVVEHLEKVKKTGSGKFMESFYVGYGHESIGDCGSTTLFIEGISTLAAKAVQDWPLYSGQETSTRYIDMAKQPIDDPLATTESHAILQAWMEFYVSQQEPIIQHLKTLYPRKPEEAEAMYEKAIKARSFDILRSFLPAGINTQIAWHTNLRQAARKVALLMHHPDPWIRALGERLHTTLKQKYPTSFGHKTYESQETYRESMAEQYTYFDPTDCPKEVVCHTMIDREELKQYQQALDTRPIKTELPFFLLDLGLVRFEFQIDFGSFRDIQRHRNGVCRMPLLTTRFGFHQWYLDQLPPTTRQLADTLIQEQTKRIQQLDASPLIKQYYTAMGFNVPCRISYGLPAALYTIELRSGKTVHPSLRRVAQRMAATLKEQLPELTIHADMDLDDWDVRRGMQDITYRPASV